MVNLTYVTGNYGKYISVKEQFEKENILINYFKYDLVEADINDIKFISKEKARNSYKILKKPVFVIDSGFYIKNYPSNPGYPGAFVKRSGISSNIDKLLDIMKEVNDRSCCFIDCLTFYDGKKYYQFFGVSVGNLAYDKRGEYQEKAKSNLWYVFIPNNCIKTLAEMNDYERENRLDGRTNATLEFINWYKNVYMMQGNVKLKTLENKLIR